MAAINSPNMSLPIPGVGSQPGPQFAFNVNQALTLVDSHDHSPGRGVQITPAGILINATLNFRNQSATNIGLAQLTALGSPTAILQALSVAPGGETPAIQDLWYTDSAGNAVQLTSNGLVNATIASLPGETYAAGVFYWKQGSGSTTPADFDIGSITLRPNTALTTAGIKLSPPSAIASFYTIVLPDLPAQQSFMTLDTSGNILNIAPDNVTLSIGGGSASVINGGREHNWELNGDYGTLTMPQTGIDAIFFAPYNITINSVWIFTGAASLTGGTTEFDLKVASPGGAYTSILSTTGKITYLAGDNVWTDSGAVVGSQTGVTKPVISTSMIGAGQAIRFDLLAAQTVTSDGFPADARIRIYYTQR